jgi:hypothetical protein
LEEYSLKKCGEEVLAVPNGYHLGVAGLVQFVNGEPATLFLVPSCVEGTPNTILESRDYGEGKKSAPEWGLTLSKKKLGTLADGCGFVTVVSGLL